ncbi:hypothetical protein DFH09DRAFT_1284403 [Mycena vulgaris]|nr:hypothetical protein DFH09DRAFT_1284403 [Mycena vulgaris]
MPRVSTTPASRAPRKNGGRPPPSVPLEHRCLEPGCPWSFKRKGCLNRHLESCPYVSSADKESSMIECLEPGCEHKTLQMSNMVTHFNARHSGLKPHVCGECDYRASDPSCLYKHKLAMHSTVAEQRQRKRKAKGPTATFPYVLDPASSAVSIPLNWDLSSSWTTPSPASSSGSSLSLPYCLDYPPSPADEDFVSYSPVAAPPEPSYAYPPSPMDEEFASYSPVAEAFYANASSHASSSSSSLSLPGSLDYPPSSLDLDLAPYFPGAACAEPAYPYAPSPSSATDASIPESFDAVSLWQPTLEEACLAAFAEQFSTVAPTSAPGPALQHAAESIDFFVLEEAPRAVACEVDIGSFTIRTASGDFVVPYVPQQREVFVGEWDNVVY